MVFAGEHYAMGQSGGTPQIPLDLVREYGGAGTYLVAGVLAALLEAPLTGRGQIVDAGHRRPSLAPADGSHGRMATAAWTDERGVNLLDGRSRQLIGRSTYQRRPRDAPPWPHCLVDAVACEHLRTRVLHFVLQWCDGRHDHVPS
jgi:hypothetical protein